MSLTPNDHERAVRALEEHGHLFQKACVAEASFASGYAFQSEEYPVSVDAEDSVIDFVLAANGQATTYLIFECKRANPKYVTWLFSTEASGTDKTPVVLATRLDKSERQEEITWLQTTELTLGIDRIWSFATMGVELSTAEPKPNESRRKSSKSAMIYDACQQALTGVGGLALEHQRWMKRWPHSIQRYHYLPVVITTAELCLTEFKTSAIDLRTGTLRVDKARTSVIDWLFLDIPVREGLQVTTPEQSNYFSCGPSDQYRRKFKVKSVAIVKGTALRTFLTQLREFL